VRLFYLFEMKEKILAALGFPPPEPLKRLDSPIGDSVPAANDGMLLVDARQVADEAGLKAFYRELKNGVGVLRPGGKAVLLSQDLRSVSDVRVMTFQRAIEGVCRSLAKEVGAKGTTVNLLRVPAGAAPGQFALPLHFFGSGRSAFITGQALTVGATEVTGSLRDKVCVVTGGAGGIGSATVRRLAAEGGKVVIADIGPMADRAKALESDSVTFVPCDLTGPDDADRLLALIKERFGRLDVLVNNAGITRDKTLKNMPENYWDQVIAINLSAVLGLTEKALAQGLVPAHGRIINTSSISGIAGNFGQTNYTATKAALIAYGEGLGREVGEKGITVNAIAPGFIDTDMVKTMPFMTRMFAERLTSLAQAGRPSDIAEAVAFLAHPAAQGVNGQVLRVCGGSFLGA